MEKEKRIMLARLLAQAALFLWKSGDRG